jgi:hypothetical protein
MNYSLSSLSFIIIGGGIFLSITSHEYQYYPAQLEEGEGEESSNDIFSDLSRNLPSIEENILNDNEGPMDSERPIFENHDTKDLDDNNEVSNSENIVESNDQGATSESIEKSFNNGFSDSGQAPDIINEDDSSSNTGSLSSSSSSSSNTVSNHDASDKNIQNSSD